jgi:diadenosine tetraphosphate (Ap4A) HIT family hydrolase
MRTPEAPNASIAAFGYPGSLIADYRHWVVLLRPQQVTLGSLILACTGPATAFSDIGREAFAELATAVGDIERVLGAAFAYDKINYLMLMMVDPHVHFHVLPRYREVRTFAGTDFEDAGWPAAPDLKAVNDITKAQRTELIDHLRAVWPRGPAQPSA